MKKILLFITTISLSSFAQAMEDESKNALVPIIKGAFAFYGQELTHSATRWNISPQQYKQNYQNYHITANTVLTNIAFFSNGSFKHILLPLSLLKGKKNSDTITVFANNPSPSISMHGICSTLPGSSQTFSEIVNQRTKNAAGLLAIENSEA